MELAAIVTVVVLVVLAVMSGIGFLIDRSTT
jgi:preprotein translocase subunit SecE